MLSALYVYHGLAKVGDEGREIVRGDLAILDKGDGLSVSAADAPCRLILVARHPLNEPVARYSPFAMHTREEIIQTVNDFNTGRL